MRTFRAQAIACTLIVRQCVTHLSRLPRNEKAAHGLAAAVFAFALLCSLIGIDFGYHWDEQFTLGPIEKTMQTGIPIPNNYRYPSFMYAAGLVSIVPDSLLHSARSLVSTNDALPIWKDHPRLRLRVRTVCATISLLSIIWTYLWVLVWRKKPWEALFAAALLGLSWEIGYHSRWIATDVLMMQFGALTMFLLTLSHRVSSKQLSAGLLTTGAITAGLAASAKYTGAILLFPVWLTVFMVAWQKRRMRLPFAALLRVTILSLLTYIIITPGTLLNVSALVRDLTLEYGFYRDGFLYHTVAAGLDHTVRSVLYFMLEIPSHFSFISILCSLLFLIGLYDLLLRSKDPLSGLFLITPVLYFTYFMTRNAMLARNLLLLVPFYVILTARGGTVIMEYSKGARLIQRCLAVCTVVLLTINAGWLLSAALSIQYRNAHDALREFVDYANNRAPENFWVSEKLQHALKAQGYPPLSNIKSKARWGTTYVAFYGREMAGQWLANDFTPGAKIFGPWEVNYLRYPGWAGNDRIVVIPYRFLRHHIFLIDTL